MHLSQLFKVQEIIESKIVALSNMDEDTLGKDNIFDLRFLALQVKTSEIANLTKCYKYSRIRENTPKDKLFLRYIDAMRFLLSIGNVHHFNIIDQDALQLVEEEESVIKLFSYIFDDLTELKKSLRQNDYITSLSIYIRLFSRYVNLGKNLGFSFDEVYDYYVANFDHSTLKTVSV